MRRPLLALAFAVTLPLASCSGASGTGSTNSSHSVSTASQAPPLPGASAAVRVNVRRILVDEIDNAPDPTRVLPPSSSAPPDDADARHAVVDALEQQRARVAQCYLRVRVDTSDAIGNALADIAFAPDGSVRDVLVRPEPILEPLGSCLTDAIRAARIQPPPGHEIGAHAVYRFHPHGASIQESRYRLSVSGAHAPSTEALPVPRACVPLVLQHGYVTDDSEDETHRYPSLGPWDAAQRERLLVQFAGLHDCYTRTLARSPGAFGSVQVRVVLAPDGRAQSVRADAIPALHDVAECARTAVQNTPFCPGPDGTMTVLLTGIEFLPQ